ncbi:hypothetical protein KUTeg_012458 [Tegillarca granosa]|uniref:Uncharacterized protein n=1 Tax=Tegillarca granosa TaxID=220873 RepID=A0ABQ9EZM0_TEGGR|nr:hypothetical protein KUTeg_012458 [Tegillarca granosa]
MQRGQVSSMLASAPAVACMKTLLMVFNFIFWVSIGQYSGFLILVFVIELSAGIAGFAYKEKLNSGFSEGLKIAIKQYGKDEVKTTTFDDLQTQVKFVV